MIRAMISGPGSSGAIAEGHNLQRRGVTEDAIVATGSSHGRARPHVNRLPLNGILTDCKKVAREGPTRLTLRNFGTRRRVRLRECRHLDDPYVGSAERFELLLGCALVRDQRRYPFDTCHDH
jgi:hypothetical protein